MASRFRLGNGKLESGRADLTDVLNRRKPRAVACERGSRRGRAQMQGWHPAAIRVCDKTHKKKEGVKVKHPRHCINDVRVSYRAMDG